MPERLVRGDEAIAHGALVAGIKLAASYPGSPSTGVVETLIGLASEHGLYVEWSSNERVALELAIGASIAGRRALVLRQERRHERDRRPTHDADPDARARRAGDPAGGRPRRLWLAERPGHPAPGDDAGDAPARAGDSGRGLCDDVGGV